MKAESVAWNPKDDSAADENKHLVFRLADELYATPLISIQEISKLQTIKPVPFMVNYFRGIVNLRGTIVSVIDLRAKLELSSDRSASGLMLVVETEGGPIAAIVDDVVAVHDFEPASVERNVQIRSRIPLEYFIGIAHFSDRLVNIIKIAPILTDDDCAAVRRIRSDSSIKS